MLWIFARVASAQGMYMVTEEFLGIDELRWANLSQPVLSSSIQPYQPMMHRVDSKAVKHMVEALKELAVNNAEAATLRKRK